MATREVRTDVVIKARVEGFEAARQEISKLSSSSSGINQIKGFNLPFPVKPVQRRYTSEGVVDLSDWRPGEGISYPVGSRWSGESVPLSRNQKTSIGKRNRTAKEILESREVGAVEGTNVTKPDIGPPLPSIRSFQGREEHISNALLTEGRDFKDLLKSLDNLSEKLDAFVNEIQHERSVPTGGSEGGGGGPSNRNPPRGPGSFLHGFFQGALPTSAAPFLKEGEGMFRQAAGQYIGEKIKTIVSGLANTTFQGIGGVQQGLQGIPIVGGIASGLLGNAVNYSKLALEKQRTELELLPYFQGKDVRTWGNINMYDRQGRTFGRFGRKGFSGGVEEAGLQFAGLNVLEALPMMGDILEAGGGNLAEAQGQGMVGASFAARRLYGVDSGISGAFLKAGRRGGLSGLDTGSRLGGGNALASSIGDAMRLGLEGSEINKYLKIMADGINRWEQTGIPVAKESILSVSQALSGMGISGPRGINVAGGMVNAAQALSTRGPKDIMELMMLQTLGGYKGGGSEDFEAAQIRLEKGIAGGGYGGGDVKNLLNRLMRAGGGGATGRKLTQMMLRQLGINVSSSEMLGIGHNLEGIETPEERTQRMVISAQNKAVGTRGGPLGRGAPSTLEDLLSQSPEALRRFGGGVSMQAGIVNRQTGVGAEILPAVQNLELTATNMTKAFSTLISGPLTEFSKAMTQVSEKAINFAQILDRQGIMQAIDSLSGDKVAPEGSGFGTSKVRSWQATNQ